MGMDSAAIVFELWPRVCRILGVDPGSIHRPLVRPVPYGVIEVFGGCGGVMYHKGDNTIMIAQKVDRGQLAHEVAEAVAWLSPEIENFSEDLARMVEEEMSHEV